MKVNFFGHNCFLLEGKNVIVVTDPWLTNKGAFFGSWYQWPINHHLKGQLIERLDTSTETILYISHEHQDHFDKETLQDIQPYINLCIIPEYEDKFLYNEMLGLGYEVTELPDKFKHYFNNDDYLELMIVETGVNHDSASLIHIDDENFLNQNDCKIFDRLVYLENLKIDYYAVQFSGATWHPICYQLTDSEKVSISKKRVMAKLVAVRNAIKLIKPKYYLPSAGPAIFPFLEESLSLGIDNIFIHQPEMNTFLKSVETEIVYLKPGEQIKNINTTKPIEPPKVADLKAIKKEFSCEFENITDDDFNVEKLLDEVRKRIEQIKDIKFGHCPIILFDWKEHGLEIDLKQGKIELVDFSAYQMPNSYMMISASKAYFSLMSNPVYRWQDIALSLRVSVQRKPDMLNTFVNIFVFSDRSNIRSGFTTTLDIKDERIVIINPQNGKNYEVNRYCPHTGADLKDARIDDYGNLICPRHSWQFNLENEGKCTTAEASLYAKEIVET
jgi:UDP-MurNAc hydroxylase